MITLTKRAAEQVLKSAEESGHNGLSLRIAAKQNPDQSIEYGIGFDEAGEDDMLFKCEGIEVIIAPEHGPLLKGAEMDYAEIEPGKFHFIFLNPNDPHFVPPKPDGDNSGGCSTCG